MKNVFLKLSLCLSLVLTSSCLKESGIPAIPGVDGPKVNVQNGKILVGLTAENLELPIGFSGPVSKKLKNTRVSVSPGLEGGTVFQVYFDPKDIKVGGFQEVPAQTLPDGRPFPFLTNGELPSFAFQVEKAKNMTFYASEKTFGFFLPLEISDNFQFDVPFRLKINGKQIGIVSVIGNNADGEGSGIVVLLTMSQIENNKDLQSVMRLSKKRKYRSTVF